MQEKAQESSNFSAVFMLPLLAPLRHLCGWEPGQSVSSAILLAEVDAVQTQFVIQVEKVGVQTIVDLQNFPRMQRKAQPIWQVQKAHLILELLCANVCVAFVANGIVCGRDVWFHTSLPEQALQQFGIRVLIMVDAHGTGRDPSGAPGGHLLFWVFRFEYPGALAACAVATEWVQINSFELCPAGFSVSVVIWAECAFWLADFYF